MNWTLVDPLKDIEEIAQLAEWLFNQEGMTVLKKDPYLFRKNATVAACYQMFDRSREFFAVCRNEQGNVLGYCWFDRGGYATYSREEISNAKFHHVDLTLPVKTRVKLIRQMIEQHILWAGQCGIPIICSTSIRKEHDGFMRIHEKMGFEVNGSYAWIRTEDALKRLEKK
jgi:hypothetical protein